MSDTKKTNPKIIIAVDGYSSCGKSTFAKAIAARLGYIFIDTGAMYRAVTLYALEHGAIRSGMVDEEAVVKLLGEISITFRFNPQRGASDIYVNGDLVEGKIRTIEVSNCVSQVSAIPEVRHKLVASLGVSVVRNVSLGLSCRWQDRTGIYTDTGGMKRSYSPYAVADARLEWLVRPCKMYVEANNLLNTTYVDYGNVPQPGFWFVAGASVEL